jgi:hypothetical protein
MNGVLRKISGPKRQDLSGDWRTLHDEEPHDLYCKYYLGTARSMRCTGHMTCMEKGDAYRVAVGNPDRERALGGPRSRWQNNIKIDLKEI